MGTGRYDLQTFVFWALKNAIKIGESVPRSYMGDEGTGPSEPVSGNRLPTTLICAGKEAGVPEL
jgi:hypothetical protein